MNIFLMIMIGLAMIAVVGVLVTGLVAMGLGGKFNEKYGNKLMQYRLYFQGAALALLLIAFLMSQTN